jgi:hypothetical protein
MKTTLWLTVALFSSTPPQLGFSQEKAEREKIDISKLLFENEDLQVFSETKEIVDKDGQYGFFYGFRIKSKHTFSINQTIAKGEVDEAFKRKIEKFTLTELLAEQKRLGDLLAELSSTSKNSPNKNQEQLASQIIYTASQIDQARENLQTNGEWKALLEKPHVRVKISSEGRHEQPASPTEKK